MQVRDFMIYNVYTASATTTVKELISLLNQTELVVCLS